jgi:hypothetical protein
MQWWSALTRQFTEIASQALRDTQAAAAAVTPPTPPAPGTTSSAAAPAAAAPATRRTRAAAKAPVGHKTTRKNPSARTR